MIHDTAFIHPFAITDGVRAIGARSKVWQFASVIRGAILGEDCNVASGACFDGSHAGDRVIICHNLAAGPGFLLGNDVFIGPNCTLGNDNWPTSDKEGFDVGRFDGSNWAIIIEDGASVGANSMILPGVVIGKGAMVAAGSVVNRSVPAGHLWKDGKTVLVHRKPERMRFASATIRHEQNV